MENVVLTVHLILALSLIGVVLMQRSEGGGLGMGGGGAISGRAAATALGKITWGLAIAFICTSLALTIIAASNSGTGSVLDRITDEIEVPDPSAPGLDGSDLLPPGQSGDGAAGQGADQPLVPKAD